MSTHHMTDLNLDGRPAWILRLKDGALEALGASVRVRAA